MTREEAEAIIENIIPPGKEPRRAEAEAQRLAIIRAQEEEFTRLERARSVNAKQAARIALVKEHLKLNDADAAEFVSAQESLSDEAFAKQVKLVVKQVTKSTPAPLPDVQKDIAEFFGKTTSADAKQEQLSGVDRAVLEFLK